MPKTNRENITIEDMLSLSMRLYQKHKTEWRAMTPENNIYWIAWLVGEIGEVIDIMKKEGTTRIMHDPKVRQTMLEEITDCYMYLADILNRYKFTGQDFSQTYFAKMSYNFKRNYHRPRKFKQKRPSYS